MSGASWDERKTGDWLASNGRWYPANSRPKGWDRTALPPAPDHDGGSGSGLGAVRARLEGAASSAGQRISEQMENAFEEKETFVPPPAGAPAPPAPPPARPAGSSFVTGARSASADATVVEQRTHASRLPEGAPPPPAIGAPPSPGRVRDDAPPLPAPAPPNGPAIVAGDLGRVLGGVDEKIDQHIDDSIHEVDER